MKNIIIGVSGSIACYKSFDLLRMLKKNNPSLKIKVVLTKGTLKFLNPDLFNYLGADNVYSPQDDFNTKNVSPETPVLHIELARWCEHFILYPGSANTLANFAHGKADDLLSSIFLSLGKETRKTFFPAMNTQMLNSPITQNNLSLLNTIPHTFIYPPDSGELLCGEKGSGKLPLPDEVSDYLLSRSAVDKKKVVTITTGATSSPLDSIRFLTNPSSGLTGFFLASYFLRNGYFVNLIATSTSTKRSYHLVQNKKFKIFTVKTTEEMYNKALEILPETNLYISSAAPCDIQFQNPSFHKLKKAQFKESLPIKSTPDILQEIIKRKKKSQKVVGFAAESSFDNNLVLKKFQAKPVDLLVLNEVNAGFNSTRKGFSENDGTYSFYTKKGYTEQKIVLNKEDLASKILNWYEKVEINDLTQNQKKSY